MRLLFSLLMLLPVFHLRAQQLVLPADHPDPSVVQIGNEYWAAGTTSNWFPAFTLYRSHDLVNWKASGHVFNQMPAWADYYMWAPEITYENGKVYLYYTGHKKGGSLCIAAAVADKPEGPYRDLGPLMCEADGSIDAFPMRDEQGKLYMIWKEDGNSKGKPTPIWAQEMKEDRTGLLGTKKELFRADSPWEKGLVEGVSIIKRQGYFYAFYAAAACCGKTCSYGTGVARAKNLLGPWEKFPGNPVLADNDNWKCPGHGTPVEKDGRFYYLYHGYSTASGAYGGRQGLLSEFQFTPDGWLQFIDRPERNAPVVPATITDLFAGNRLDDAWHWSVFQPVRARVSRNSLQLQALPGNGGAYVGRSVMAPHYDAQVTLQQNNTAEAGLALVGDDKNMVYASVLNGRIRLVQLKKDQEKVLMETAIPAAASLVLKVAVTHNTGARFMYSTGGAAFKTLNDEPVDIAFLPPWDRAVRIALLARGAATQQAFFKKFMVNNRAENLATRPALKPGNSQALR
ncbi:glycoside hydrolase family 43 protein [Niabella sp. 22666]|uniref:glycoside hydrolase family 43 protein n=1 Tax=Niabella sp. 22666 TaxID=3453954 RepID=UPI003F84609E